MTKKLIINADDYGLCREVNGAIENLISEGRIENVSVLANSWHYESAIRFLSDNRHVSVGVHLNVVEGLPVSRSDSVKILAGAHGEFLSSKQLLLRWFRDPYRVARAVETEWREQIELLVRDGFRPTHADSHQHIHAFPPFWRILVKLCSEFGIPAIRSPYEFNFRPGRRLAAFALGQSLTVSKVMSPKRKVVSSDHFLGFKRAGSYGETEMINDLSNLKNGVTELAVHPSLYDGIPYKNYSSGLEYKALLENALWRNIERSGIELVTWAQRANDKLSVAATL